MSTYAITFKNLVIGYSAKTLSLVMNCMCTFFQMDMKMPNVVKTTMAMMVIVIMGFTLPSCSSSWMVVEVVGRYTVLV